ncbi:MAG TPA: c-type cytochrome [Polyangia bacterium]|nr:c-type cytochrome [Polyangia bacterium]
MTARAAWIGLAWLLLGGCRGSRYTLPYGVAMGGDPAAGKQLVEARHCGVCHDIDDVTGAAGVIGPPLDHFAARSFIAGRVPNTPANLITWIRSPQSVDPRTAMPSVGLGDAEARNVAAYLYTLR